MKGLKKDCGCGSSAMTSAISIVVFAVAWGRDWRVRTKIEFYFAYQSIYLLIVRLS